MAKTWTIMLRVVVVLTMSSPILAAPYSGGSGTEADPYKISTLADWQVLMGTSGDWVSYFILTADIDLARVTITSVGQFPGKGHILHNVAINQPGNGRVGLFGHVGSGGQIINLGIEDANIQGSTFVGGLVGFNYSGIITSSICDVQTSGLPNSTGGKDTTTAEMKTLSTFIDAEWDFINETQNGTFDTWTKPKNDYPILSWQNQTPVVSVGLDLMPNSSESQVLFLGLVEDDGFPLPVTLTSVWSMVSGPGAIVFEPSASVVSPMAVLSVPDVYVLRLTASDGQLESFDEVTVTYTRTYSGGSGADENPYIIATSADLIALGQTTADYGKHLILTADGLRCNDPANYGPCFWAFPQ